MLLPAAAKLRHREGHLVAALKLIYRCILPGLIRFPKSTLAATAVFFILIGCTMPWLGEELMPKFKRTDFQMHWVEKPGIGIDAMNRIKQRASQELMAVSLCEVQQSDWRPF